MAKFKKGHTSGYKKGHVPSNKHRKRVSVNKSDTEHITYKRLTRKMTNLVLNVPYKEEECTSVQTTVPAKLLRPTSGAIKMDTKVYSAKDKQR